MWVSPPGRRPARCVIHRTPAFRSRLQQTIAARDVSALLSIVHSDIKNTFGEDNGIDAFKRLW